jgi:hypothetical protein
MRDIDAFDGGFELFAETVAVRRRPHFAYAPTDEFDVANMATQRVGDEPFVKH